jgi:hypothetical protein
MNKIGLILGAVVVVGGAIGYFVVTKNPNSPADNALIQAAHEGDLEGVKKALDQGARPNAAQKKSKWEEWFTEKNYEEGNTAMIYAAQRGSIEMLKLLLDKGADINQQSDDGVTPVMNAAHFLHKDAVQFLIEKGADLSLKSKTGSTVKDAATKRNATPQTRELEQIVVDAMQKQGLDGGRVSPGGIPQ